MSKPEDLVDQDYEAMTTDELWAAYGDAKDKFDKMNTTATAMTQSSGRDVTLEQKRLERTTRNKLMESFLGKMNSIALVLHLRIKDTPQLMQVIPPGSRADPAS